MDRMVDDRTLDDNVESFFSHDALDPKDTVGQPKDISKGTVCSFLHRLCQTGANYLHLLLPLHCNTQDPMDWIGIYGFLSLMTQMYFYGLKTFLMQALLFPKSVLFLQVQVKWNAVTSH